MGRKLEKATDSTLLHPRDKRSPRHEEWKRNIRRAMRRGTAKRQAAGALTPREMAGRSWLGMAAIYRLMDSGELPFVQVGNRRYVRESDFEKLLKRMEREDAA